jgi:hypothetical protein
MLVIALQKQTQKTLNFNTKFHSRREQGRFTESLMVGSGWNRFRILSTLVLVVL